MHPDTLRMYLNVIKTTLTKENWKKYKKEFGEDPDMAIEFVKLYHRLGRDSAKFNKVFELILTDREIRDFVKTIDKSIELSKEKIKRLERLKKAGIMKMIEKKVN